MSSPPAISIITPVWNGLPYIKECIASVLAQEFYDWEHLIGDNGSTDGTWEYLQTLSDPRIQIFRHDTNLGISGNFNFLFSKANAPIAYILCADDYFHPGGIARVIEEWRSASAGIAFICFQNEPGMSLTFRYAYSVLPRKISPGLSQLAFFLFGNFTGNVSNVSVRVTAFNSAGGFVDHLKTAQDFDMWHKLAKKNEIILTEKKVAYIREHEGSATHYLTRKGDDYVQLLTIYENLIEQLSEDYDRRKLTSYFNMQVCPQYYRTGIKYAFSGRFTYFKRVLKAKSSILWETWKQLLICVPLAIAQNMREYLILQRAKSFIRRSQMKT